MFSGNTDAAGLKLLKISSETGFLLSPVMATEIAILSYVFVFVYYYSILAFDHASVCRECCNPSKEKLKFTNFCLTGDTFCYIDLFGPKDHPSRELETMNCFRVDGSASIVQLAGWTQAYC